VQNTKQDVFRCIAEACKGLDVQLVIAHGGGMNADAVQELPGSPLVVDYAPQLEVIAKASLTITHGGLNTVLDSLSHGVPLVAMPITFEQPGNGARIRWTGTGEVIPISQVSVSNLQTAIQKVLTEESYRHNARRIQQAIAQAGGVRRAADIIEQVISPQSSTLSLSTSRTLA
jgi:MGT family glycosyltransferase